MTEQMIVRLDSHLKSKAASLARAEGKNVSGVVRELLEAYVKERDIETYVSGLWDRIGKTLKGRGVKSRDIQKAIRQVRRGR